MASVSYLVQENFWSNKAECDEAEERYYLKLSGVEGTGSYISPLAAEIAKARQHIKNSLECVDGLAVMANGAEVANRIKALESENDNLKRVTGSLKSSIMNLQKRVTDLEAKAGKSAPAAVAKQPSVGDDDNVDLFGSSDEDDDEEKAKVREERLKAYAEKKAKKPALIAKTSVVLDVKPWDSETDMNIILQSVKSIKKEGLIWGESKLVPVGYGIKKLQILGVVEDEKVSIDDLIEQIEKFEELVQSVDIVSMSKI